MGLKNALAWTCTLGGFAGAVFGIWQLSPAAAWIIGGVATCAIGAVFVDVGGDR